MSNPHTGGIISDGVTHDGLVLDDPAMIFLKCSSCKHLCVEGYENQIGVIGFDAEKRRRIQWTFDPDKERPSEDAMVIIEINESSVLNVHADYLQMTMAELNALAADVSYAYFESFHRGPTQ